MEDIPSWPVDELMDQLRNIFVRGHCIAADAAERLEDLFLEDTDKAIASLHGFLEEVRDINTDRAFVEAAAGGPNHDWTVPVLNVVGLMYPSLQKPVRERALLSVLDYLDGLNYFYSQNHVERMKEPWLVGDIIVNRRLYWCGFSEYHTLFAEHNSWKELQESLNTHPPLSAFWLAMAVLWWPNPNPEIRREFYEAYPHLVDRTLDAIAGMTVTSAMKGHVMEGKDVEAGIQYRLSERYDPDMHARIREKIAQENWILLPSTQRDWTQWKEIRERREREAKPVS